MLAKHSLEPLFQDCSIVTGGCCCDMRWQWVRRGSILKNITGKGCTRAALPGQFWYSTLVLLVTVCQLFGIARMGLGYKGHCTCTHIKSTQCPTWTEPLVGYLWWNCSRTKQMCFQPMCQLKWMEKQDVLQVRAASYLACQSCSLT